MIEIKRRSYVDEIDSASLAWHCTVHVRSV